MMTELQVLRKFVSWLYDHQDAYLQESLIESYLEQRERDGND